MYVGVCLCRCVCGGNVIRLFGVIHQASLTFIRLFCTHLSFCTCVSVYKRVFVHTFTSFYPGPRI